jgi:hypothetical protein
MTSTPTLRRFRRGLTLAATGCIALTATACSDSPDASDAAAAPAATSAVGAGPAETSAAPAAAAAGPAAAVTDKFIEAVNAGRSDAVAGMLTDDARVDIVGRVFTGRGEVMDDFIGPEVIGAGGEYEVLNRTKTGDGVLVEYNFETDSGLKEHFTYRYAVQDGLIHGWIGRYV